LLLLTTTPAPSKSYERYILPSEIKQGHFHGGSGADILVLRSSIGLFVRKVGERERLSKEITALKQLSNCQDLKNVAPLFPKLLAFGQFDDGAPFFHAEYIRGPSLADAILNNSIRPKKFFGRLAPVLQAIASVKITHLTPAQSSKEFEELYTKRIFGRREEILKMDPQCALVILNNESISFSELLQRPKIYMMGTQYTNPYSTLQRWFNNPKILDFLLPRIDATCCAHGDLTLGNTIFDIRNKNFRLIDFSGKVDTKNGILPQDLLHDFGKFSFSLLGFPAICARRFTLENRSNGFYLSLKHFKPKGMSQTQSRGAYKNMRYLARSYESFLSKQKGPLSVFLAQEPSWPIRIRFIASTQFLCDLFYRIKEDPNAALAGFLYATKLIHELDKDIQKLTQ